MSTEPHSPSRRSNDPVIELIAHKVGRMEQSVDKLTEAITKLAVIEERQLADRQSLERAFLDIQKADERSMIMFDKCIEKLEKIESRTDALERMAPSTAQTTQWVNSALWAAASFAVFVVTNKLGLV